jgi:hypothetical protein
MLTRQLEFPQFRTHPRHGGLQLIKMILLIEDLLAQAQTFVLHIF